MTAKISPRHRQAFVEALAETGNYVIAAAEVRVSRDWAFRLRRRDAGFDAACREAVEKARVRLGADSPSTSACGLRSGRTEMVGANGPLHHPGSGPGWPPSPSKLGEDYVVERGNGRVVQMKRSAGKRWTHETERRFLTALAGCCNVRLAAAELGVSAHTAYKRRRNDPGFARAWAEAIEIGYARLEAALVEAACCFFEGEVVPDDNPIRTMSVAEAIQSLNMNKFAVKGVGKGRPGWKA